MACASNYATVDQVKAYKVDGAVIDLTAFTDDEICNAILIVEAMIESITNDIFYEKSEVIEVDGNGYRSMWFYPSTPYRVLTITSVQELNTDRTVHSTYVENNDFLKYAFYLTLEGNVTSRSRRYGGESSYGFTHAEVWPRGSRNIKITATWGRETTPLEITDAVIRLTLEKMVQGSTGMSGSATSGIERGEWDDFQIEFGGQTEWSLGKDTGFTEIDRVLRRYINYIEMFYETGDGN